MSETHDDEDSGPADDELPAGADAEAATADDDAPPDGPGEVDLEALEAEEDAEEDGLDLSDLDELGVEGVVARMRSADPGEGEPRLDRGAPKRSPIISPLVVAVGVYLLFTMFADFRYWLRSSEPVDLGHAATLLQDGRTMDAYENQYVVLEGTPDVQNAARLTTKEQYVGYLRVTEGEGGLFAAVPRSKDQPATNNFEGRYQGRLRRLEEDRAYEWLREFYAAQKVSKEVDLDPDAAAAALGSSRLPVLGGGTVEVGAAETLWLSFRGPDARVQLGKKSFADQGAAERAVAALGHPYTTLDPSGDYYRFVVRIPEKRRTQAHQTLNAGLVGVDDNVDPKVGAFVLDLPMSYSAPAGEVAVDGGAVDFPYGDNTTMPGYEVSGERLVERARDDRLRLPVEQLSSLRLERVIEVHPESFVIAVDETPSKRLLEAVLWLVVFAITAANLASLVLWWRRRGA